MEEHREGQVTSDKLPQEGYLYIVRGPQKYFAEAARSVESLRRHDPQAHATLVTDRRSVDQTTTSTPLFDHRIVVDGKEKHGTWEEGLAFKTANMYNHSPYKRTFFVDSDTYFVESCRCLFELLDYEDPCVAQGHDTSTRTKVNDRRLVGYNPYNTGIILFKKRERVKFFFEDWNEAWQENLGTTYPTDQSAFMQALLSTSCKTYVLRNNWNARSIYPDAYGGKVKLIHGRHENLPRVARRINVTTDNRAWLPEAEACVYPKMGIPAMMRVLAMFINRTFRNFGRNTRSRIKRLFESWSLRSKKPNS